MPIITNAGQQPPVVPPKTIPAPPPTRIQSVFTQQANSTTLPKTPPPPSFNDTDDEIDETTLPLSDTDDDDETDGSDDFMPVTQPKQGKQDVSLSRMSEEQRRETITNAFQLVLGKDPADRDFSYYRFSTLTMEGLIKSLLNLPEHKKLVEKAHEHTALKQSVSDLDLQVKQLNQSMLSMKQELITMQQLLVEKNRYIQQMRGIPEDRQSTPASQSQPPQQVQQPMQEQSNYSAPVNVPQQQASNPQLEPAYQVTKLPGPFDEMKAMFKSLLRGGK